MKQKGEHEKCDLRKGKGDKAIEYTTREGRKGDKATEYTTRERGEGEGIRPGVVRQQEQSMHGNTIIKPSVSLINLKNNSLT